MRGDGDDDGDGGGGDYDDDDDDGGGGGGGGPEADETLELFEPDFWSRLELTGAALVSQLQLSHRKHQTGMS